MATESGPLILTYILIGINILVSLAGFSAMRKGVEGEKFLFIPFQVAAGRNLLGMLLSHFSHADGAHLLFNMMSLYFFAPVVEDGLGALSLLAIYVTSGIFSSAFVYYFHRKNPEYRSLGASGSVSGVIFASIVLQPGMSIYFLLIPIPIPGPLFAILYIAISTYFMRRGMGNISHEAHIGGAVAGFLLAGLLSSEGFRPLLNRISELLP
jgi:membrane associated rhomboid family serine protease